MPILVMFLVVSGLGSLNVYMPICAAEKIQESLNYTLANFGHIPYGKTVIGELIIPQET